MNKHYDQEIRYRLLKILDNDPNLSQRRIAKLMGISLGKVNYCLAEFGKKGFVKINRFRESKTKFRYIYNFSHGIEEKARVTVHYLRRKMQEFEEIKQQILELTDEVEELDTEKIHIDLVSIHR